VLGVLNFDMQMNDELREPQGFIRMAFRLGNTQAIRRASQEGGTSVDEAQKGIWILIGQGIDQIVEAEAERHEV